MKIVDKNVFFKKEFIRKFAEDNDITIKDATEITDAFLGALKEAIIEKDKVVFAGFGMFSKVLCQPKEYIHPSTHMRATAPARVDVKFRPQFDVLKGKDPNVVFEEMSRMTEEKENSEEEQQTAD